MIYAQATHPFEAILNAAISGLTGTVGVRILDNAGATTLARTTSGIAEQPAGSGIYAATLTAPSTPGQYVVVWDTGGGTPVYAPEELAVSAGAVPFVSLGTEYTTPDAVRGELGLNSTQLDDTAAGRLILTAEDLTDDLLGAWPIDPTTGRKILPTYVEDWQWVKLQRFTTLLAAEIYANPTIARGRQWEREYGPDFQFMRPVGTLIPDSILAVLNSSGLRRATCSIRIASGVMGNSDPLGVLGNG